MMPLCRLYPRVLLQLLLISALLLVNSLAVANSVPYKSYVLPNIHDDIRLNYAPFNRYDAIAVTWDHAYDYSKHGFDGTYRLTQMFGKYNLTPIYDIKNGSSNWLYPMLLPNSLSMYKITRDKKYLECAQSSADSIEKYMLNEKDIIRMYSYKNGASNIEPTSLNSDLLSSLAELSLYDPSYKPLASRVANGIINHGLSKWNIPYGKIYPNGTAADTVNGLPSNGYTISITVMGLLRTYESTGDKRFLDKSHDILISIWNNKRSSYNLIPRTFDAPTLETVYNDTQLYATGEFLRTYIYYYYLTDDPTIKEIISAYSKAAYNAYWARTPDGQSYFVYRVNVETGEPSNILLETNWHKLDMSLIYAGEITGNRYKDRTYKDMNTFWLGKGLAYRNHLFRHATKPDGRPGNNTQSLVYSGLRTSIYVMIRMLNDGGNYYSNKFWNEKVWDHIDSLRTNHYQEYGYHTDVDVETLKPDAKYYGLKVIPACGEFASLVTLMFRTTPNVKMAWETFPSGSIVLEPFTQSYTSDSIGFMRGVFMDYAHKEIAFKNIMSKGKGRIYSSQRLIQVRRDGQIYDDWNGNTINVSNGIREYVIVLEGGHFTPPRYP
jgi:hypothetical protein